MVCWSAGPVAFGFRSRLSLDSYPPRFARCTWPWSRVPRSRNPGLVGPTSPPRCTRALALRIPSPVRLPGPWGFRSPAFTGGPRIPSFPRAGFATLPGTGPERWPGPRCWSRSAVRGLGLGLRSRSEVSVRGCRSGVQARGPSSIRCRAVAGGRSTGRQASPGPRLRGCPGRRHQAVR